MHEDVLTPDVRGVTLLFPLSSSVPTAVDAWLWEQRGALSEALERVPALRWGHVFILPAPEDAGRRLVVDLGFTGDLELVLGALNQDLASLLAPCIRSEFPADGADPRDARGWFLRGAHAAIQRAAAFYVAPAFPSKEERHTDTSRDLAADALRAALVLVLCAVLTHLMNRMPSPQPARGHRSEAAPRSGRRGESAGYSPPRILEAEQCFVHVSSIKPGRWRRRLLTTALRHLQERLSARDARLGARVGLLRARWLMTSDERLLFLADHELTFAAVVSGLSGWERWFLRLIWGNTLGFPEPSRNGRRGAPSEADIRAFAELGRVEVPLFFTGARA